MMFLMDPEFWMRVLGIIVIDLTLAGDNALVIALAIRTLPKRQQFWGRIWGTAGAVGLRLLFITVATILLKVPFLQLVGGLLLLWIAFKLVRQQTGVEGHVRQGGSLRDAIWIIIVADAVMSLDNVLAVAAAAHGDLTLVVFGIALSLPSVVWGSGLLATLMNRFGWIIWLGGGILGYVAGEMILKERHVERFIDPTNPAHDLLPILPAVIIVVLGWWFSIQNGRKKVPENAGFRILGPTGQDLRSYLDLGKRRKPGDFEIVSKPVDPRYEITALVVKLEREAKRRPVVILEEVKGGWFPVLTNLQATRPRLAAAMSAAPEATQATYLRA